MGARSLSHRPEKNIHAGPMAGHQSAVTHLEKIGRAQAANENVTVSGSDESPPRHDLVAISGFSYVDPANAIEPFCEGRGEAFGHMLYRHDSRTVLRHLLENLKQSLCASSGCPDGNYFFPLTGGRGR